MANVKFLQGSQDNLNKYLATYTGSNKTAATEGAFYLTTDTNRLYIGKNLGGSLGVKAVPINQGAIPVDTTNNLPTPEAAVPGQFYYVVDGNILAVSSGGSWVQINTNTNDDHFVKLKTYSTSTNSSANTATINEIIYNTNASVFGTTEYIKGTAGLAVEVIPVYRQCNLTDPISSAITYYTKSGDTYTALSSTPSSMSINYYIQTGYTLQLTPAPYSLTSSYSSTNRTLSINLSNGADSSSINLIAGDNIQFTHSNNTTTIKATQAAFNSVKAGTGNGSYSSDGSAATSSTNGFYVETDIGGAKKGASFDPQISYGKDSAEKKTVHFDAGTATLDIYTAAEVDKKIRLFNAMEYQGTTTQSSLPSTGQHIGYVYMANDSITIEASKSSTGSQVVASIGDLIIAEAASGTEEGADGTLSSTNLRWSVVHSGNDYDTIPGFQTQSHGFILQKSTAGGTPANIGSFKLAANSNGLIELSDSGTDPSKIVTLKHKEYYTDASATVTNSSSEQAAATATSSSLTIEVPIYAYDKAGHITNTATKTYKVVDSHATISAHSLTNSVTNNVATLTSLITMDGANESGSLNLTSGTLTFSKTSNTELNIDLVWGTFA